MKRSRRRLYIGLSLLSLLVAVACFAPLIAPYDPNLFSLEHRLEAPSLAHLFGCDQNGADVLSQVIFGARVSLSICFVVVTLTAVTGLILGSIAGWFGGLTEQCLMRTIDLLHAFPGFLLALALVAALGPSLTNLVAALCLTGWTGYARLVRGEVLHLKNRDHVLAAVALGAKPLRIVVRHIWPNLLSLLLIQASFGMAGVVISESGLSYLGLGAPPTTPTWGALINSGRRSLLEASHLSLFPGLALFTLVLALNLVGNGLRDWLDPRNPDLRHG